MARWLEKMDARIESGMTMDRRDVVNKINTKALIKLRVECFGRLLSPEHFFAV